MNDSRELVKFEIPGSPGQYIELTQEQAFGAAGGSGGPSDSVNLGVGGARLAEGGFNVFNAFVKSGDTYRLTAESAKIVAQHGGLIRAADGGLLGAARDGKGIAHMARFAKAGKAGQLAAAGPMAFAAVANIGTQIQMAEMQRMLESILDELKDFKRLYQAEKRAEITSSLGQLQEIADRSRALARVSDSDLRILENISRDMDKLTRWLCDIVAGPVNRAWAEERQPVKRIKFVDERGAELLQQLCDLQMAIQGLHASKGMIAVAHGINGDAGAAERIYQASLDRNIELNATLEELVFRLHTMAYIGYVWHRPDRLSSNRAREDRIRRIAKGIEASPLPISPSQYDKTSKSEGVDWHIPRLLLSGEQVIVQRGYSAAVTGKIRDEKASDARQFRVCVTDRRVIVAHRARFAESGEQIAFISRDDIVIGVERGFALVLESGCC